MIALPSTLQDVRRRPVAKEAEEVPLWRCLPYDFFDTHKLVAPYDHLICSSTSREFKPIMAQELSAEKKQPKSFEALTPTLAEWILDYTRGMSFARTTPVQAMAIPLLMTNKDLVVEVSPHLQYGAHLRIS